MYNAFSSSRQTSKTARFTTWWFCSLVQEKEAMEAAIRAFEDWEFRVLEQESGIDDEEEGAAEEKHEGSELETELSSQQHVVNAAQVNNTKVVCFFQKILQLHEEPLRSASNLWIICFMSQAIDSIQG